MVHDPEDHVRDREEDDDTEKVFHPRAAAATGGGSRNSILVVWRSFIGMDFCF
jgi:hypothetical protein